MKFEFGMVVGMDYVPELRVMVLAPKVNLFSGRDEWWGVVLRDDSPAIANPWAPGHLITLSGDNTGLTIVDTPEGSE